MKHKVGYNRLGRKSAHRKAMTRNMLTSLFRHERIKTTKAKALAVRRVAEKMITRAGTDSVHNRRMVGRDIKDKAVLAKIFTDIGPRFKERPGGYTRVLKLGPRHSDAAEMVILELVAEEVEKKAPARKKKSAAGSKEKEKSTSAATSEKKKAVKGTASTEEAPAEKAPAEATVTAEEAPAEAASEEVTPQEAAEESPASETTEEEK